MVPKATTRSLIYLTDEQADHAFAADAVEDVDAVPGQVSAVAVLPPVS